MFHLFSRKTRYLPSDHMPISLLCQAGKVMERCIHKHFYNYVITDRILTPLQSGFVPGDSTTCQMLHMYHMFFEATVNNGKEVWAVFCDISAKPSTGSGTRDYSINYGVLVVLKRFWLSFLAISQVVDNG